MAKSTRSNQKKAGKVTQKPNSQPKPKAMPKKQSLLTRLKAKRADFLSRRPHRSFRLTKRRDYSRSLKLPGYFAFSLEVTRFLKSQWKTFGSLILVLSLLVVAFGAIVDQATYQQLTDLMEDNGESIIEGGLATIVSAGAIAFSALNTNALTEGQQVYLVIVFLVAWMTTVWLAREYMAGRSPKLRDGLYNASAPLVSTVFVFLAFLVQLLPLGLVIIARSALQSVGIDLTGIAGMAFYLLMAAVIALTLYWLTTTFIAMIIITLPGVYPRNAFRVAGDLVVGRRLRILLRIIWASVSIALIWLIVVIPTVLLVGLMNKTWEGFGNLPVAPSIISLVSSALGIWFACYVYLLYRKIVADDAEPA